MPGEKIKNPRIKRGKSGGGGGVESEMEGVAAHRQTRAHAHTLTRILTHARHLDN